MKRKAKAPVIATKVNPSDSNVIKKSIIRKEHKNVFNERKPTGKTIQSKSGLQMRNNAKNFGFRDPTRKERKQNNNSPIKRVSWALDAFGDATNNSIGINIDDNMKEDLPDIANYEVHKRSLKRTAVPKIESRGQDGKKGASGRSGGNVDTTEGARNSRVHASSKEKSASVKRGGSALMKSIVKSGKSENSTTPKTSPKKQRKSAVPAAEPKKNSVINGGGGASGGKMKEISVGNGVVGYKMKREFYAIHTAEIVGKAEIQMTKKSIASRDTNESPSEIPTSLRRGLKGIMKSARRKKAK